MATFPEFTRILKEFGDTLNVGRYEGMTPAAGQTLPLSFDEEVRQRVAAARAARTAVPSVASAPAATAPAAATPAVQPTSMLARVAPVLSRFLSGVGIASLALNSNEAGAGSDVITDAQTGAPLRSPGVALDKDLVRRAGIPTTGAALTPAQVSAVQGAADDAKFAALAKQDAAAQQFADERTARVNKVIADSQATSAANDKVDAKAARTAAIEQAVANVPLPEAGLFKQGFAGLPALFAQTMNYVSQRGQLNRLAKQDFTANENQANRDSAAAINSAKIQAEFLKKLSNPDIKIATVKSGLSEQPLITVNGKPTSTATLDDKGNVTIQPVRDRPTTAQAHAEAKAKIESSSNKAFTKQQINARLAELGYPPLP